MTRDAGIDREEMLALHPLSRELKRVALAGADLPHRVVSRSPVLQRWHRSRALGADPDGAHAVEHAIVDAARLHEAHERTDELKRGAGSILGGFASACSRSDFVGVLCDAGGVVVQTFGAGTFAEEAHRARLVEGATWDESVRGTNAVGTALAEGRPIAVHGAAHYARINEGLVCFAAPILDPSGEIVGVLDATSRAEQATAFDPGVVITVARAIEEVLRARAYAASGGGIALVERLMERAGSAAFLVERPAHGDASFGRIARANRAGRAILAASERASAAHDRPVRSGAARSALPPWRDLIAAALGGPSPATLALGESAFEIAVEPVLQDRGATIAVLVLLKEQRRRVRGAGAGAGAAHAPGPFSRVLGSDGALADARQRCERIARSHLPVLFLAETGTGKELFARGIHEASPRADGPYVSVNCGAIQRDLLLSELFGHAPGAFTGAVRGGRDGLVAAADGGTLFLDEVADLSPDAQVALLRVLEDGHFQRVGEAGVRSVDIRIVAATSRDLRDRVANGLFRDDLYFRIGGALIELPPLRERDDLDELVDAFWARLRTPDDRTLPPLSAGAREALRAHEWPGNVRELESALSYAAALAEDAPVAGPEHLPQSVAGARQARDAPAVRVTERSLDDARRTALRSALERHDGNVSAAARDLGVARSTVYRLARKLGL